MQNVDLGHTKSDTNPPEETLSHQGVIIHENCCSAAQCDLVRKIIKLVQFRLPFKLNTVLIEHSVILKSSVSP